MKKFGLQNCIKVAALLFLLSVSNFANALEFIISEKDINRFAKLAFPYKQSYNGADIFFSDPKVILSGLENELRIQTKISAYKNNQLLKADAEITGELRYDPVDYNLQIKEPMVSEFKLLESTMDDADQIIRGIRDVVGQSLPVIVLIDLDTLDMGFGKIQPKSIVVGHKKLIITL